MTNNIRRIHSIDAFHKLRGLAGPSHPLISLVDYGKTQILPAHVGERWTFDFYSIGIKRNVGTLRYGQQAYDFNNGILSFIAPNQVLSVVPNHTSESKPSGWLLLIHPDFFWNTSLAKTIQHYEFFQYAINEALFMSEKEEVIIENILLNIRTEIETNLDSFSQDILIAHIELLLNYAERFYQRQFITRKKANTQMLERIEELLNAHFENTAIASQGLPTVQQLADQLNLSASYLGSLLKSTTGLTAQQHIHEKLIAKAKEKLTSTNLSISEIAYDLGFEHSQSFSKLFKSKTQLSPSDFRVQFN